MKVAIVGATHGNEKTGAWLIEKWKANRALLPDHHDYFLTIGNPRALAQNSRYVDFDLNRSFNGGNSHPSSYEFHRAAELKQELTDWSSGLPFFLIDLHTTTANMGTTLIMSERQSLNALILKETKAKIPEAQLIFSFYSGQNIYLNSLSPYGMLIEIGPTPQNLLLASSIEKMERATLEALSALPKEFPASVNPVELEGYLEGEEVQFPHWKDSEGIKSYIHPCLQDRDFELLNPGDSIFINSNGQVVTYQDPEPTHALFINEAAYYEKGFAFTKSRFCKMTF